MDTFVRVLPLLPLRGMLVFPGMVMNLDIARARSLNAVSTAMRRGKHILLVAQKNTEREEPELENLYRVGVVAEIKQMVKLPGGNLRILVEGILRASLDQIEEDGEGGWQAAFTELRNADDPADLLSVEALRRMVVAEFEKWVLAGKKISPEVLLSLKDNADSGMVADMICGYLDLGLAAREEFLETISVKQRLERLYKTLHKEMTIAELEKTIAREVHQNIEKTRKNIICVNN